MGWMNIKSALKKVGAAAKAAQAKKAAETKQQASATPPQQKAGIGIGAIGLARRVAEKAKAEGKLGGTGAAAKAMGSAISGGGAGLRGPKFRGLMGKAMSAAAQRAKMKGEEEKTQAFKKGGAVKKRSGKRGMGIAKRNGGCC